MPRITFKHTLASRSDSTPTTDGFTYHHALPWRYYYLAGVILAHVARLRFLRNGTLNGKYADEAVKQLRKSGATVEGEYGRDGVAFDSENPWTPKQLLDLCLAMHGTAVAGVNSIETALKGATYDLGAIGNLCGAPKFGGFLGMAPEHRKDDPSDGPELVRPRGALPTWWGAISLLRVALQSACPGLSAAKAQSTVTIELTSENFESIVKQITQLTSGHNAAPYAFDADDWYLDSGGPRNWEYITGIPAATLAGLRSSSKIGKVFCLREAQVQSGTQVRHADRALHRLDLKTFNPNNNDRKYFHWYPTTQPGVAV